MSDSLHALNGLPSLTNVTIVARLQAPLATTQTFFDNHRAAIELVVILGMYSRWAGSSVRYLLSPKRSKAAHYPPKTLAIHIIASFLIVARYYVSQLFKVPTQDAVDLVMTLVQISTSFYLAQRVQSNDILYKSSFQAMAVMNVMSAALAFATGSPQWHRIFVKCIDWFAYYRLFITAIFKHKLFGFPKVPYTVSIHLVSAPFTLWAAGYPAGLPVYLALLVGIMSLNQSVSARAPEPSKDE